MKRNIIIILLGLLAIVSVRLIPKSTSNSLQYQTSTVTKDTLVVSITNSGQVTSTNSSSVTTNATGVVKKIYVKDGDMVKAGAPLVEIELDQTGKQKSTQAYASYQSAKNNLSNAQSTQLSLESQMWQANQDFLKVAVDQNKATNEPEYIQSNRDWLSAEEKYKAQQNAISQTQNSLTSAWLTYQQTSPVIYAPISGKISGLSLQVGSIIGQYSSSTTTNSTTKLANVLTNAAPIISVGLTEIDIPKIKVGQPATITFDALPDKTYTGKVISIDDVGSVSSGVTNYPVAIALDTPTNDVLSNMSASVTIISQIKDNTLLIPNSALRTQNGEASVRVLKNNQPTSVTVTTGISSDTQTEILSGLQEGDVVITGIQSPSTQTTNRTGVSNSPFGVFGGAAGGAGRQMIRISR